MYANIRTAVTEKTSDRFILTYCTGTVRRAIRYIMGWMHPKGGVQGSAARGRVNLYGLSPLLWLAAPLACFLYFYHLNASGLVGPDEPRYAAVAREMARSGDWVTPRLWGEPWFEKPPLLYWMAAVGFRFGLGPELAPRLPVAILAVAFLSFYWWVLRREFGCAAAWFSTLILGTCAGWIGFSQIGVTDLPLAATFSAAMLLA